MDLDMGNSLLSQPYQIWVGMSSIISPKDSDRIAQIVPIAKTLLWFSGGVAMAAFAAGFAYLTNYAATSGATYQRRTWNHPYVEETARSKSWRRFQIAFQWCAVRTAMLSLGCFIIGTWNVEAVISHLR